MKQMTVNGKTIDLRSDHLIAMVKCCYELAVTGNIPVLNFGDNENALDTSEQIAYIEETLQLLRQLTKDGNQDLLVVAADNKTLDAYHQD